MDAFQEGGKKQPGSIEEYSSFIDVPGRKYLHSTLTTHSDPYKAIDEIQDTFGLKYSCSIAIPFLDMLEVSRASLYQGLFERSKSKLEDVLQYASEQKLLEMLSATFRFITVKDLKSIPIGVIKKLPMIPEKYLKALSSKKLQNVIEVCLVCGLNTLPIIDTHTLTHSHTHTIYASYIHRKYPYLSAAKCG